MGRETSTDNPVVLVVEDDPAVRELLDDVLGELDYEVVAVEDGGAALRIMRSVRIDLITLDLDLPGLSGDEFLGVIQGRERLLPPVVLITSDAPVSRGLQSKVQAVVHKPFDVDELIEVIRGLLTARGI
ncbi:MAG TPA: response regulator [Herpetosiphonaceae bacterium]|nr:response regulator [Herpetosiphonaceae bacterium]